MSDFNHEPTRKQIEDAHNALDWLAEEGYSSNAHTIRAALPPRPLTYEELEAKVQELQAKLDAANWDMDLAHRDDPKPLPDPENAKEGEYYLVELSEYPGSLFAAERSYLGDWYVAGVGDEFDDGVRILARLLTDREVQA